MIPPSRFVNSLYLLRMLFKLILKFWFSFFSNHFLEAVFQSSIHSAWFLCSQLEWKNGFAADLFLWDKGERTSLVVQQLRIRLPMQGTQVQSLVWEDPTCCGVTKPVHHNTWASVLEPMSHNSWSPCALEPAHHNYWTHAPQLLKPTPSRAHVLQLLSLCAATTKARVPTARALQQEKLLQWEARALQCRVAPAHHN